MASQAHLSLLRVTDDYGRPLAGAKAYFYEPGTTTPRATYQDDGLTVFHPHPVIADAHGLFPLIKIATGLYKLVLTSSSGTQILSADDIDPSIGSAIGSLPIGQGGTGATTAAQARTNLGAASSATVTTLASDLAALSAKVATGLNVGDPTRFGLLSKEDTVRVAQVTDSAFPLQRLRYTNAAYLSSSASIPVDDTIPQINEGVEILSGAITPKNATSLIKVTARGSYNGTATGGCAALFEAGSAAAIATCILGGSATELVPPFVVEALFSNTTIAAKTFSLRMGQGAAATFYVNGTASNRLFGGVNVSSLELAEYKNV